MPAAAHARITDRAKAPVAAPKSTSDNGGARSPPARAVSSRITSASAAPRMAVHVGVASMSTDSRVSAAACVRSVVRRCFASCLTALVSETDAGRRPAAAD